MLPAGPSSISPRKVGDAAYIAVALASKASLPTTTQDIFRQYPSPQHWPSPLLPPAMAVEHKAFDSRCSTKRFCQNASRISMHEQSHATPLARVIRTPARHGLLIIDAYYRCHFTKLMLLKMPHNGLQARIFTESTCRCHDVACHADDAKYIMS